ncbi:MAG: hypothetical protein ATN35_01110 [Epulopiscium sp. Nele67-Bin004]|nr:MAG: hypothetical protein ATN35_01110 [Epulopiscium sp. Nele67-Bin004]
MQTTADNPETLTKQQQVASQLVKLINNISTDQLKDLIRALEPIFDTNESISHLLGIPEKKVKKLGQRDRVKLDAILKRLFESSPRMFLGTIDDLYKTNYRNQYLSGELTDADITFLSTEAIRDTFRFEVLRADIVIKIKDSYYQIELQTSHDNMAIRFARYGLEIGINNLSINPETGVYKIQIPEQSVIFLENNKNNPRPNHYEIWWKNEKVAGIQVKELKLWELNIQDVFNRKLYNLLPILIFEYRLKLSEVENIPSELEHLKNSFLSDTKNILSQISLLTDEIADRDIDLVISVLGELIMYFDSSFFGGSIERIGEFKMTFSEQISGYREEITQTKENLKIFMEKVSSVQQELSKVQQEVATAKLEGKIETLYTECEYTSKDISNKLDISLDFVEEVISKLNI